MIGRAAPGPRAELRRDAISTKFWGASPSTTGNIIRASARLCYDWVPVRPASSEGEGTLAGPVELLKVGSRGSGPQRAQPPGASKFTGMRQQLERSLSLSETPLGKGEPIQLVQLEMNNDHSPMHWSVAT
jgi:hypothetical protein